MAYIGAEPVPGQNREVDDISSGFNGNATAFTLQVNSVNVSPESAKNILVNLGGVLQNPDTDYTINASTLTFTTAPASGLSFFGLILGAGINTATVADGAITTAKLASDAVGANQLANTSVTAGSYTTADITVDAQGRITAAASGTISGAEIADQAVTNAKVNNSAAIAGSKISPDFGSQNIVTTGSATIGSDLIHAGDTDTKISFGTDTISLTTNNVTRMTFTGNFIDLPDAGTLRLGNSNDLRISHGSGGASNIVHSNTSQPLNISATGAGNIAFLTNSNERMRINSSGNVGIGATTIANDADHSKLAISGQSGTAAGILIFQDTANNEDGAIFSDDGNLFIVADRDNTTSSSSIRFRVDGSSEKMRIDSSGNVGIGTTSPDTKLHVVGTAVQFQNTQRTYIQINTSDTHFYTGGSHPLRFGTNSTERMRILDNGRIGINVTTSDARVTVSENANLLQPLIIRDANNTNSVTHYIGFRKHDSEKGSIKGDRGGTSFNTTSDYRLKQNVTSISDGITRIKQLLPKKFSFIEDETNTLRDGFLAHEVSSLVPEAVDGTKDAVDSDNKPIYQGIDHSKLVPLLTAALKEAVTKIETLETKVAALEAA